MPSASPRVTRSLPEPFSALSGGVFFTQFAQGLGELSTLSKVTKLGVYQSLDPNLHFSVSCAYVVFSQSCFTISVERSADEGPWARSRPPPHRCKRTHAPSLTYSPGLISCCSVRRRSCDRGSMTPNVRVSASLSVATLRRGPGFLRPHFALRTLGDRLAMQLLLRGGFWAPGIGVAAPWSVL